MQIFANGKQRSYSFMEFYVIHLKHQRVKIILIIVPLQYTIGQFKSSQNLLEI